MLKKLVPNYELNPLPFENGILHEIYELFICELFSS